MSSNSDKPFEPGERIIWLETEYEVIENNGRSGTVRAVQEGGYILDRFSWDFDGEIARRKVQPNA